MTGSVHMLVLSEVGHDVRVQREAATLARAGYTVRIVCRAGAAWADPPPGVEVHPVGARSGLSRAAERTPGRIGPVRRAARWLLLPEHRRATERSFRRAAADLIATASLPADVVHAHDLPTLPLGAELARERGVPLVYDAHECWTGRRRTGRPNPLADRRTRDVEQAAGDAAAAVLTVSDGLADWLAGTYGWDHITVVRNTFPQSGEPPSPDPPRGAVYAGRLGPGRDLETVVAAARRLPDLEVALVGPRDERWLERTDLSGVTVREPLAPEEIGALYRQVGIALVPLTDDCLNHRLALPNKLFQAVQAGVPVVAADLPELRRVVTAHDLGTLYRPTDPGSLAGALGGAIARHPELAANCAGARPELSWEADGEHLLAVYEDLC